MRAKAEAALRRINVVGLLAAAGLLGLWEATVRAGVLTYQHLPAPSAIGGGVSELAASGALWAATWHTLTVTLIGWGIAGILGVGLGLLLGLSDTAHRYSMTSFEVIRAIPPITFVPAALLIFGFSQRMELVIVVYAGAWPLLVNTIGGVRGVPDELLDVAHMLRMRRAEVVRKIVLPAAMPAIVVGLRLALSMCLVLAVVAEIVGNPAGLGNALVLARSALQPEQMFAYLLATGMLGVGLNGGFRAIAGALLPAPADDTEGARSW